MLTPIRSLIGLLTPDGTYQARSCHELGHPRHQIERLAEALHRYHGGDVDALFTEILTRDWQWIAPSAAAADGEQLTPVVAVAYAGIGYATQACAPAPASGTLAETTTTAFTWLYLWDGDQLRVFLNDHVRARWQFHNDVYLTSPAFADTWRAR